MLLLMRLPWRKPKDRCEPCRKAASDHAMWNSSGHIANHAIAQPRRREQGLRVEFGAAAERSESEEASERVSRSIRDGIVRGKAASISEKASKPKALVVQQRGLF